MKKDLHKLEMEFKTCPKRPMRSERRKQVRAVAVAAAAKAMMDKRYRRKVRFKRRVRRVLSTPPDRNSLRKISKIEELIMISNSGMSLYNQLMFIFSIS